MQLWALFKWWYGQGWLGELKLQGKRLIRINDYFAFGNLVKTLFQPFRQIDAGPRKGGLEVQFRAWLDKTISRIIGAFARLTLIIVGGLWLVISMVTVIIWLVVWPLLPIAPILGLIFTLMHVGASV